MQYAVRCISSSVTCDFVGLISAVIKYSWFSSENIYENILYISVNFKYLKTKLNIYECYMYISIKMFWTKHSNDFFSVFIRS